LYCKTLNKGAATNGKMMAKDPYPHRQLVS
jgi:hypothetical protein